MLTASTYLRSIEIFAAKGSSELHDDYERLLSRIKENYTDPRQFFMSRLFITYISAFEIFLQEIAAAVLIKYPGKLGSRKYELHDILESPDPQGLVNRAIEEQLNELMYKKPLDYVKEFGSLLSLNISDFTASWKIFIEAKARRDLGVHGDWICNKTYIRKLFEANISSGSAIGTKLVPNTEEYFDEITDGLLDLAEAITGMTLAKHFNVDPATLQLATRPKRDA